MRILFFRLLFLALYAVIFLPDKTCAQSTDQSGNSKRFFTGLSFALGNAAGTHYNRNVIVENGFSYLMPSREIVMELGYVVRVNNARFAMGFRTYVF
jgi:hypothetical protein